MKLISITFLLLCSTLFIATSSFTRVPVFNTLTDFVMKLNPVIISLYGENDVNEYRVVKFGVNLDLDTGANEDVVSFGGLQTFLSTAETLDIVSSDGADTSAGTGARIVNINGIDANGLEITEDVIMNGTTPVTTVNSYLFVNEVLVIESGSSLHNIGNITIDGTTSSTILAYVLTTYSATHQASYRVPSDHKCYVNDLYVTADKLSGSSPRVIFYIKVFNIEYNTEYILRRELLDTATSSHRDFLNFKDSPLLPGEIISIEASSSVNDTQVSAMFDLTCVKAQ